MIELVLDVAAAGQIAEQDALTIADELGLDVLVGGGVLHHGADVNSAFVGEGALADERLIAAHLQIGAIGDEARDSRSAPAAGRGRRSRDPSSVRDWR